MKNILKNKLFAISAVIFLLATGCGGSNNGNAKPVVLNVWGVFEDTENMNPFFEAFQQKYPNVQINYTEKNVDTYEQDLLEALASGQGPDVYMIHNDWLPKYKDRLIPATSNVITVKDYKDSFVDVASDDFIADGKVYAAPLSVDSLALYYNKDILGTFGIATPPKTWNELKQDVKRVTSQNGAGFFTRSGVAMGTTTNINRANDILYLLMLQNHTIPYSDDKTQATFDQAVTDSSGNQTYPAADALTYFTSFSNSNSDVYTWNSRSNYSVDAFSNGQLAFMYGYYYTKADVLQKSPNLNFDVAPVPQPNLDQNSVNFANYWGLAVSKQSKASDYSWALIKSMVSKDSLNSYYQRHKLPASRKDLIAGQINDAEVGDFANANLTAKSFYKADQPKVDSIITSMIDGVVLHGQSVSEALSTAAQQVSALSSSSQ